MPPYDDDVGALHAVVPLTTCPHLNEVQAVPAAGINATVTCRNCNIGAEVWICLTCYQPHCGRFVHGHAAQHQTESHHNMALSMADLSVWCYACDAYVHNAALVPAKTSAHESKFGVPMPH